MCLLTCKVSVCFGFVRSGVLSGQSVLCMYDNDIMRLIALHDLACLFVLCNCSTVRVIGDRTAPTPNVSRDTAAALYQMFLLLLHARFAAVFSRARHSSRFDRCILCCCTDVIQQQYWQQHANGNIPSTGVGGKAHLQVSSALWSHRYSTEYILEIAQQQCDVHTAAAENPVRMGSECNNRGRCNWPVVLPLVTAVECCLQYTRISINKPHHHHHHWRNNKQQQ